MLGRKNRAQLDLFITGSLEQLVPEDHILARAERILDLGWLREEVADCYCADNGRPGVDPEVAVRLMLAGLLLGIVHDRRLLREAQVNHRVLAGASGMTRSSFGDGVLVAPRPEILSGFCNETHPSIFGASTGTAGGLFSR